MTLPHELPAGLAVATAVASALGQTGTPPSACSAQEPRQFDFWIGHWEVFAPDGRKVGENFIEPIEGGCALLERWHGRGGSSGSSLNSWDAEAKVWRQHWVDNRGGVLRLAGGLENGRMVLSSREPKDGQPGVMVRQRITWTPLPDGAVRQHWESSEDDGRTWKTEFDGRYVKVR